MLAGLTDPAERARIASEVTATIACRWHDVHISAVASDANAELVGRNLQQIGDDRACSPVDALIDVIVEERGAVNMISFPPPEPYTSIVHRDQRRILREGAPASPSLRHVPTATRNNVPETRVAQSGRSGTQDHAAAREPLSHERPRGPSARGVGRRYDLRRRSDRQPRHIRKPGSSAGGDPICLSKRKPAAGKSSELMTFPGSSS